MESLERLYQELIIDHSKQPHNYGSLAEPTLQLEGFNPLCGDRFTLYVQLVNDQVCDIKFSGQGCAISTASTSIMTDLMKGKRITEIERLIDQFQQLATQGAQNLVDDQLGKAKVFAGVSEFPMRVKCATLSWHTMRKLLTAWPNQTT